MLILGLDPGIATVGFGIIDVKGRGITAVTYGAISTAAGQPLSERLSIVYDDLTGLLARFNPEIVVVEELFFNTNHKTAIAVAHARGIMLLAAQQRKMRIYEYTPLQVKQSVAGYGRAEKKEVMEMVKRLLGLERIPKPDDAADALAIALCHARAATSLLYKEWGESKCTTT